MMRSFAVSKLEDTFCAFLAENNFVNALIQFIRARVLRMIQAELFSTPPVDLLYFEQQARTNGFRLVAGIDEAGRGPLAGPVVAAAVILPAGLHIKGVNDSKKLSPDTREHLFDTIMSQALSVGIGMGSPELIDRINILQATLMSMHRAVDALRLGLDLGMTHIDTAEMYGNGRAEELVGEALDGQHTRDAILESSCWWQGAQ